MHEVAPMSLSSMYKPMVQPRIVTDRSIDPVYVHGYVNDGALPLMPTQVHDPPCKQKLGRASPTQAEAGGVPR